MKAYEASFNGYLDDEEASTDFVFANNAAESKKAVANRETIIDNDAFGYAQENGASYTDIRVRRCPNLDDCENLSKMEIAEKLILYNHWYWYFGDDLFNHENFDKKKFEKAWKDAYREMA